MLYGKRIYEPQSRLSHHRPQKVILNKAFQYKYTLFLLTTILGGLLIFCIPAYYFINQNYQLFTRLAYDTQPGLVTHLEREVIWIGVFMLLGLALIAGTTLIIGLRMTKKLLAPLMQMEKHMKELIYGHWNIADYKIGREDEFRDLAMTYDYFYRSLKANTEAELKLIEKLAIDPQNREAFAAWKNLILIKRSRLGIQELPFQEFSIQPLSRRGPDFEPAAENTPKTNGPDVVSIEVGRQRRAS